MACFEKNRFEIRIEYPEHFQHASQPFLLELGGILQSSRRGLRTVERPVRKAGRRKGRTIAASSGLLRSQRIVNIAGPGMRAQEIGA